MKEKYEDNCYLLLSFNGRTFLNEKESAWDSCKRITAYIVAHSELKSKPKKSFSLPRKRKEQICWLIPSLGYYYCHDYLIATLGKNKIQPLTV